MAVAQILLPLYLDRPFDYAVPEGMCVAPGDYVRVPLGKAGKEILGVVWAEGSPDIDPAKLKPILARYDGVPPMDEAMRKFIDWVAWYNVASPGMVLRLALPVPAALTAPKRESVFTLGSPPPEAKITEARARVVALLQDREARTAEAILAETRVSRAVLNAMVKAGLLVREERAVRVACPEKPSPSGRGLGEGFSAGHPPLSLSPSAAEPSPLVGEGGVRPLGGVPTSPPPPSPGNPKLSLFAKDFRPLPLRGEAVKLTEEQRTAAARLCHRIGHGFSVTLLDGITGSGKTEVYFEAVAEALAQGKQALVLLPEIGLSVQWLERCERRFGLAAQVWHSGIAPGARKGAWRAIADGSARLIVGARSALFLPYADLGLIVVDEEHDGSYKQEEGVIYQGRDMAVARGRTEGLPVILASATPSLETLVNAQDGKYGEVRLNARHHAGAMPQIVPIDLRQQKMPAGEWISPPLKQAISDNLRQGEQTLLFLNRRGYAPLLLCRKCGHRFACPQCTAWLVWHRHRHELHCHHCDHREPSPAKCPSCGDPEHLAASGPGIERLEEEVLRLFPTVRLLTLSSETMQTPKAMAQAIHQIERGEVEIVIGTQLLAKGHHFPGLSLVGIVDGDLGLMGADLRASERCWQLLHQLSGRAGRGEKQGTVLLQTTQPEHSVMQALIRGDRQGFLALEKETRRKSRMPPYGRLAALIVESLNESRARDTAYRLGLAAPHENGVLVLGPAPAPLYRLRNKFRHRFLVQAPKKAPLQAVLSEWIAQVKIPPNVAVRVDIDPYSFL